MSLPPGPPAAAAAADAASGVGHRARLRRWQRAYGDAFTLRAPDGGAFVVLSDPEAIKSVFTADPDHLRAGAVHATIEPVVGRNSLILLSGKEHLRQRRLMLPPFHGARIARYTELTTAIVDAELDRWPVGEPISLRQRMQAITMEVIIRIVFGVRGAGRVASMHEGLSRLWTVWTSMAPGVLASSVASSPGDELARTRAAVDALIDAEVALRREAPEEGRDDILSLLLAVRDEDGGALSPEELRDELVTLLVAGHETTAAGLATALERLCRHPDALERLSDESRDGGRTAYAEAVVHEALRLRPPLTMVGRELAVPWQLGEWALPAGTIVAPCIYLVHRRPDLYPDPGAFRPERFLERPPETYTWIPFGGGVRRCIGAAFAQHEMKTVLRAVLRRARLGAVAPARDGDRAASGGGRQVMLLERLPRSAAA